MQFTYKSKLPNFKPQLLLLCRTQHRVIELISDQNELSN